MAPLPRHLRPDCSDPDRPRPPAAILNTTPLYLLYHSHSSYSIVLSHTPATSLPLYALRERASFFPAHFWKIIYHSPIPVTYLKKLYAELDSIQEAWQDIMGTGIAPTPVELENAWIWRDWAQALVTRLMDLVFRIQTVMVKIDNLANIWIGRGVKTTLCAVEMKSLRKEMDAIWVEVSGGGIGEDEMERVSGLLGVCYRHWKRAEGLLAISGKE